MTPSRPSTPPAPPPPHALHRLDKEWRGAGTLPRRLNISSWSSKAKQRWHEGHLQIFEVFQVFKGPPGNPSYMIVVKESARKRRKTNKQTNKRVYNYNREFVFGWRGMFKNLTQGKGITPHDLHTFEFPQQKYPDGLLWSHVVRLLQKIHFGGADCNQTLGFCVCWVAAFRRTSGDMCKKLFICICFF